LIFSKGLVVQPNTLIPVFILLLSVISSSYGWVVIRDLVKNRNFSPLEINGITMFMGGIASLVLSYATESWTPTPVTSWPTFLLATIGIIIVCNFCFSNLYGYLLKCYTATLLSFAGFLCPLFATGFGRFFLEEPVSKGFIYSFFAVTMGLYIFYKEELRQGYVE
jgi:drug/metabolite transporter (DMT)-like permease